MFRFFLALFAIVTSSLSANAQQLPPHQNLFTAFAVEPDSAIYADVGNAVRDFKEVCLAVYRAAVDNPDTRISLMKIPPFRALAVVLTCHYRPGRRIRIYRPISDVNGARQAQDRSPTRL